MAKTLTNIGKTVAKVPFSIVLIENMLHGILQSQKSPLK